MLGKEVISIQVDHKVSICLLTYNHEKYIADALQGILNQTYSNIELIILDDASTDNTVSIIEQNIDKLSQKYDSVKLIKHGKNTGLISKNCNEMIKKASGEYIKLAAGDDIFLANCISDLVECFAAHPQAAVVYGNQYIIDDMYRIGDPIDYSRRYYLHKESGFEKNAFKNLMNGDFISAVTAMTRKCVYDKYGFHDETISTEDYEFWLRIARTEQFYYLNRELACYRRSENSLTNYFQGKKRKKLKNIIDTEWRTLQKYFQYLNEKEKKNSRIKFYKRYYYFCKEANYTKGKILLFLKLKQEKAMVTEINGGKEDISQKQIYYLKMWLQKEIVSPQWFELYFMKRKCSKVAVYGLGCMGALIIKKMESINLSVQYIIDQSADSLTSEYPVYTLQNVSVETDIDMIVVTIVSGGRAVKEKLKEKYSVPIVTIDELIILDKER